MPQNRIDIKAGTQGLNLKVEPQLNPHRFTLTSSDGSVKVTIPTDFYPNVLHPGDVVTMFLSLVRVGIETEPEPAIITPKLVGIKRPN